MALPLIRRGLSRHSQRGQLVSQVRPENSTTDVVKVLKQNKLLDSSHHAGIPLGQLKSLSREIRVVALSEAQRAVQLHFIEEGKKLMSGVFEK